MFAPQQIGRRFNVRCIICSWQEDGTFNRNSKTWIQASAKNLLKLRPTVTSKYRQTKLGNSRWVKDLWLKVPKHGGPRRSSSILGVKRCGSCVGRVVTEVPENVCLCLLAMSLNWALAFRFQNARSVEVFWNLMWYSSETMFLVQKSTRSSSVSTTVIKCWWLDRRYTWVLSCCFLSYW